MYCMKSAWNSIQKAGLNEQKIVHNFEKVPFQPLLKGEKWTFPGSNFCQFQMQMLEGRL